MLNYGGLGLGLLFRLNRRCVNVASAVGRNAAIPAADSFLAIGGNSGLGYHRGPGKQHNERPFHNQNRLHAQTTRPTTAKPFGSSISDTVTVNGSYDAFLLITFTVAPGSRCSCFTRSAPSIRIT